MENSEDILKGVVKDLALQYKCSLDPEVFKRILYRIDLLVLKVVNVSRYTLPHLMKEDPEDIYRTALLGLYNGLKTVKETESSGITYARLIAYMKCAIATEFPYKVLPELYIHSQKELVVENPVHFNLELEFIKDKLKNLVEDGTLSQQDLDLIFLRYLGGCTCEFLAKKLECSVSKIRKQIEDGLLVIRHQLRLQGIENY